MDEPQKLFLMKEIKYLRLHIVESMYMKCPEKANR